MSPLSCVLLVDHDSVSNFLTEYCLRRAGVQVQVQIASDGVQGLALLSQLRPPAPELVFLNYNLPRDSVMTSPQFLAEVERYYPQRNLVIALLVTHLEGEDFYALQRAYLRGPIFHKPLTKEGIELLLAQYFPDAPPSA